MIKKHIETIRQKNGFIIDMDGVIYHENKLLPEVKEFVKWLTDEKKGLFFLLTKTHIIRSS
jgi:NagD protein